MEVMHENLNHHGFVFLFWAHKFSVMLKEDIECRDKNDLSLWIDFQTIIVPNENFLSELMLHN